jgi:hypothetical protein
MRFSAVLSLCAAPLALAGTLQQDLVARGVSGLEVARSESKSERSDKSNGIKSDSSKGSSGENVVLVQQSQINEVIIIWVNNGGGAATQTVTDTVTVTQNGGETAAAAVATHQVRSHLGKP